MKQEPVSIELVCVVCRSEWGECVQMPVVETREKRKTHNYTKWNRAITRTTTARKRQSSSSGHGSRERQRRERKMWMKTTVISDRSGEQQQQQQQLQRRTTRAKSNQVINYSYSPLQSQLVVEVVPPSHIPSPYPDSMTPCSVDNEPDARYSLPCLPILIVCRRGMGSGSGSVRDELNDAWFKWYKFELKDFCSHFWQTRR